MKCGWQGWGYVCVCMCVSKGLDPQAAVSLVCVCGQVGMLWAVLGGAWSHSANGAPGTASESIRPHYSSCLATVLFFFPPLLLTLRTPTLPSFPLPPIHAASPVWHVPALLPSLEHTSRPQTEWPSQLAALTLIDLALMLTQTPGEAFLEREACWSAVFEE